MSASPLRGEEGAVPLELASLAHWCTIESCDGLAAFELEEHQ